MLTLLSTLPKRQNSRARMRASNKAAVKWLLSMGFDEIWLKAHVRRQDTVYCQNGIKYKALDIYNLFDGECYHDSFPGNRILYRIQVKTNSWPKEEPLKKWVSKRHSERVIAINVRHEKHKRSKVEARFYSFSEDNSRGDEK